MGDPTIKGPRPPPSAPRTPQTQPAPMKPVPSHTQTPKADERKPWQANGPAAAHGKPAEHAPLASSRNPVFQQHGHGAKPLEVHATDASHHSVSETVLHRGEQVAHGGKLLGSTAQAVEKVAAKAGAAKGLAALAPLAAPFV